MNDEIPDDEVLEERHILRVRCAEIDKVHAEFVRLGNDSETAGLLTIAFEIRHSRDSVED